MVKISRKLGFDKMNMTRQGIGIELSDRKAAIGTAHNWSEAGRALLIWSISRKSLEINEICFGLNKDDW